MKRISYFKFLENFPEFINIKDEDNDTKLYFLYVLKKRYWRKRVGETPRLLPIEVNNINLMRERGLNCFNYSITFWGKILMSIHITDGNKINILNKLTDNIMTEEEYKNFKMDIILENILKENKK